MSHVCPRQYAVAPDVRWTSSLSRVHGVRCLAFACVLGLCLTIMTMQATEDGEWEFWGANFIFFGLLLNYFAFMKRRIDTLEPVNLVVTMYLLAFVMRGLFLHFELNPSRVNPWVTANLHLLGRMSAYTMIGIILFLVGYYLPLGPMLAGHCPRMKTTWRMDLLGTKAIRIYCLCLPAKVLGVVPSGAYAFQETVMSYLGNVIGLMASLADVALILYGIYYYYHKRRGMLVDRRPFYAMVFLQVLLGLLTGYREPIIISLLALLFVRHYAWRPLKPWTIVACILVVLFLVTPVNRAFRELVWVEHQSPLSALRNLPDELIASMEDQHAATDDAPVGYGMSSLLNMSNRFHGADSLITCMATVPEYHPYEGGRTLYLLPLTVFVPRAIWPDKPKIGLGTFFRENIWRGPDSQAASGGQIAMTQMGELYINFGVWGIAIGMLILGGFHRFVYSYAMANMGRGGYSMLLFFFGAILCFLAIERNLAFAYGYLLKLSLFLYFLCRYLNKGRVFARNGTP